MSALQIVILLLLVCLAGVYFAPQVARRLSAHKRLPPGPGSFLESSDQIEAPETVPVETQVFMNELKSVLGGEMLDYAIVFEKRHVVAVRFVNLVKYWAMRNNVEEAWNISLLTLTLSARTYHEDLIALFEVFERIEVDPLEVEVEERLRTDLAGLYSINTIFHAALRYVFKVGNRLLGIQDELEHLDNYVRFKRERMVTEVRRAVIERGYAGVVERTLPQLQKSSNLLVTILIEFAHKTEIGNSRDVVDGIRHLIILRSREFFHNVLELDRAYVLFEYGRTFAPSVDQPAPGEPAVLLGLGPQASPAAIQEAYQRLAAAFHQDRLVSLPQEIRAIAQEKISRIHAACQSLAK